MRNHPTHHSLIPVASGHRLTLLQNRHDCRDHRHKNGRSRQYKLALSSAGQPEPQTVKIWPRRTDWLLDALPFR